jgi:hypothetical protein
MHLLACVMGRDCGDGNWEAWLEFTAMPSGGAPVFVTSIEAHQHSHLALERWASGLTRVYAEGALARASDAKRLRAAALERMAALRRELGVPAP